MPRSQARIHTAVWQDADFLALSAAAQRLYFLALSQPGVNLCGVVSYTAKRWARLAKDTTERGVKAGLRELIAAGFIVVDEDTEELWIRTFSRHDGVLDSPNAVRGMFRDFPTIYSEPIKEGFREGLPDPIRDGLDQAIGNGSRACSAESSSPPPDSSSSSAEDEDWSLRSEAEKRLAEREQTPGLKRITDREKWLARAIENIRAERAASATAQAERERIRAVTFGRNMARTGMSEEELREKCDAEFGVATTTACAAIAAGLEIVAARGAV